MFPTTVSISALSTMSLGAINKPIATGDRQSQLNDYHVMARLLEVPEVGLAEISGKC